MGFAPDLPNSNGDGLPRSQFSRLGKSLSSPRNTYIEGFGIVEMSWEDAKSRERNGCELCHRDAGTMGRGQCLSGRGYQEQTKVRFIELQILTNRSRWFDSWSEGAADTSVFLAGLRVAYEIRACCKAVFADLT